MIRHLSLLASLARMALLVATVAVVNASADELPDWPQLQREVLPPEVPWDGASRSLALGVDDDWVTPSEAGGLQTTPRYAETMAWIDRLCDATPQATMIDIGTSNEGRTIWMVVVSAEGHTSAEALRQSGKPTLLAQAAIHSGESDGKDGGMMFLRDLTVRGTLRELLDDANLLFIPILNVDGHERFGAFNRVNQRGPREMGWRTNANNLNLNRDYAKLDTPGIRAIVEVLNTYPVDLYADLHVTDGADYQYDITWGGNGKAPYSPAIEAWFDKTLNPTLSNDLKRQGHIPGPLIFAVDGRDLSRGIVNWTASLRFSNGYGDARHVPTILVENHSLKPYGQRVLGTRVLLESMLRTLGREASSLRRAVQRSREARPDPVVLDLQMDPGPPEEFDFLGIQAEPHGSSVSGDIYLQYSGEKERRTVPYPAKSATLYETSRPRAYWIPSNWLEVIERLRAHGIVMQTIEEEVEQEVQMLRLVEPTLARSAFEGRVRVTAGIETETHMQTYAVGSVRIDLDQPLGTLAMLLLEPQSPDSFFQWGFFHAVLQRTEYMEAYVTEPLAERMMQADPELRREFSQRLLNDAAFASDARARRQFFFQRTPWFDARWNLYPVAREMP